MRKHVALAILLATAFACHEVRAEDYGSLGQVDGSSGSHGFLTIHISPTGDDSALGTKEEPLATLQQAQKAARAMIAKINAGEYKDEGDSVKALYVTIAEGTYRIEKPLQFGPEDCLKDGHVGWSGDGKAAISGGRPITGFTKNDDGTWSAKIPEVASGEWKFRQLWIEDERATRAREPDEGYHRVEKCGEDRRTHFTYHEGDLQPIDDLSGVELVFLHDWSISRVPIKSIDEATRTLTVEHGIGSGSGWSVMDWFEKDPRYFVENAREYLDTPGEWYLDEETGVLTIMPEEGVDPNDLEIIAPVAKQLIVVKGTPEEPVRVLAFFELTLEHTAWFAPDDIYWGRQACTYWTPEQQAKGTSHYEADSAAVQVDCAKWCCFAGVDIRHAGSSAIWGRRQCHRFQVEGCSIADCGGNGIMIGEGQPRTVDGQPWWAAAPEQATTDSAIVNCTIADCGRELYGAVGVWIGLAAEVSVECCEVKDLPYTGVSCGWMWWNPRTLPEPRKTPCRENRIVGNHIHHCMQILSDGGGIYCLGDQPDSLIANNEIHDIPLNAGRAESNGMFLDQGTGSFTIKNNLIYNIDRSPLRFHKGWKNLVEDNVMMVKPDIPVVRYNDTVQERIELKDNVIVETEEEAKKAYVELMHEVNRRFDEAVMKELGKLMKSRSESDDK